MRKNISFISYWGNFPPPADWIDSQTCEMPIELATTEDPLNKKICSWSCSQGSITSWLIEEFRKIEVFKPHKKENKLPTLKAFNRSLSSSSSPALSSSVSTFERSNSLQNHQSGIRILLPPISYNGFSIWHQKTNTVETEYNCVWKYPSSTPTPICFPYVFRMMEQFPTEIPSDSGGLLILHCVYRPVYRQIIIMYLPCFSGLIPFLRKKLLCTIP